MSQCSGVSIGAEVHMTAKGRTQVKMGHAKQHCTQAMLSEQHQYAISTTDTAQVESCGRSTIMSGSNINGK